MKKNAPTTQLTTQYIEHLILQISLLSRALATTQLNNSQACKYLQEAERNLFKAADILYTSATCIGCGCNGFKQCTTEDGWGCHWLVVDYDKQWGVCSACPDKLSSWREQDTSDID